MTAGTTQLASSPDTTPRSPFHERLDALAACTATPYTVDLATGDLRLRTVHEALGEAKRLVRAVPKDRAADPSQGGYKFRGIEGVLSGVHDAMASVGVFMVPEDLEVDREPWDGYSGKNWRMYRVKIRWQIFGPAGDSIVDTNWGEALDNADKGLGKARSYAQKDLLIRLMEIPTSDADVADTEATRYAEPAEEPADMVPDEEIDALLERLAPIYKTFGWPEKWKRQKLPNASALRSYKSTNEDRQHYLTREVYDQCVAVLDELAAAQPTAEDHVDPCAICGSSRSHRVVVDGVTRCQNVNDCRKRAEERVAGSAADAPAPNPPPEATAAEAAARPRVVCDRCGKLQTGPENEPNEERCECPI